MLSKPLPRSILLLCLCYLLCNVHHLCLCNLLCHHFHFCYSFCHLSHHLLCHLCCHLPPQTHQNFSEDPPICHHHSLLCLRLLPPLLHLIDPAQNQAVHGPHHITKLHLHPWAPWHPHIHPLLLGLHGPP